MRRLALALVVGIVVGAASPVRAQDVPDPWSAVPAVLEPLPPPPATDHRVAALAGVGGLYGAFTIWAYFAWYHDFQGHPFEVGGDGYFGVDTYAGGADKLGHAWANFVLTRGTSRMLRAGGWQPIPAAVIAGGLSAAYFAFVEIKDGYYYEMSPGDLAANTLGAAFGVAQEVWPRLDELLDYRVEYWPSDEYQAIVRGEPEADINTVNIAEDYSGETYLLALHLGAFRALDRTVVSRYVDVALGFHTEDYKPEPADPDAATPTQQLFLGVSLNLQGVVDRLLDGKPRTVLHGITEVFNLPFTSLPLLDTTRSLP